MTAFPFHIILLPALLLSLLIDTVFIKKKRPWIGYIFGILPIFSFWLFIILQAPSKEYCQQYPGGCEGAGGGILMYSVLSLLTVIVYTILSVGIVILSHRVIPSIERFTPLVGIIALILTTLLGACCGYFIINIMNSGIFVRWQNLGSPSEPRMLGRSLDEKAVKIEAYDTVRVRVITNLSRRFNTQHEFCLNYLMPSKNCWYEQQEDFFPAEYQSCKLQFRLSSPPGRVIDQAQVKYCNFTETSQTSYAILDNGTVWVWHHTARTNPSYAITVAIIPGALTGLIIGVFMLFFITRPREAHLSSVLV